MNRLAVIGDPINHSLSPLMHNAALKDKFFSEIYEYVSYWVPADKLENFVNRLDEVGITGFNVTLPHKTSIINLLSYVDDSVSIISAVNTVIKRNSELIGFNTDIQGFIDSLNENNVKFKNKNILILGGGGAARAIVCGLLKQGSNIEIFNRTFSKAQVIKDQFSKLGEINVQNTLRTDDIDIIINTTSVGLHRNDIPINPDLIVPEHTIIDIIYNPLETSLLLEAKRKHCVYLGGLDMLVNQGALAFKLFTGVNPNKQVMKDTLLNYFQNNKT